MESDGKDHGQYVRHVQEETQRCSQTLLAENEHLRLRVVALESEQVALQEEASRLAAELARSEALRAEDASLVAEQRRLRDQVADLRRGIEWHEAAGRDLERRLREVEEEGHRFSQEYLEVEQQNSNLANLYVACYRLHGTLDREEVLAAIQEIVANLVGSEEMALFELDPEGSTMSLVTSFGIEPGPFRQVRVDRGLIGRAVRTGAIHVGDGDGRDDACAEEANLSACIPLKLDGRVTGALALFRLLPQKSGFELRDRELFDLLATQAAVALQSSAPARGQLAPGPTP